MPLPSANDANLCCITQDKLHTPYGDQRRNDSCVTLL